MTKPLHAMVTSGYLECASVGSVPTEVPSRSQVHGRLSLDIYPGYWLLSLTHEPKCMTRSGSVRFKRGQEVRLSWTWQLFSTERCFLTGF